MSLTVTNINSERVFLDKNKGCLSSGTVLEVLPSEQFCLSLYPYHQMGGLSDKLRIKTQLSYLVADKDKCYKVVTMVFSISFLHIFNLFFLFFYSSLVLFFKETKNLKPLPMVKIKQRVK